MATLNKGSSNLPQEYWVDNTGKKDPKSLSLIVDEIEAQEGGYRTGGNMKYYKFYKEKGMVTTSDSKPTDNLPILQYEEWKAIITAEEPDVIAANTEYKVGDWVTIVREDECKPIGVWYDNQSSYRVGESFCVNEIRPANTGCQWLYPKGQGGVESALVRKATSEEIAKAQGIVEWQVGDVIPQNWLLKQQVYWSPAKNDKMEKWIKGLSGKNDRTITRVTAEGYGQISETATCYLGPKSQYKDYPGNQRSIPEQIIEVGDIVELISTETGGEWFDADCIEIGEQGKVIAINSHNNNTVDVKISRSSKTFTIYKADLKVVSKASEPTVPVTVEDAYSWQVGDVFRHRSDSADRKGWAIISCGNNNYQAQCIGDKVPNSHIYSKKDIDGYITSGPWIKISNQTQINNQSISSQIKIKSNVNTEQKVRYTGSIVCSITSQIRQPESRRQGGISGRECKTLIGTGNL
jgi:hypothetical protein